GAIRPVAAWRQIAVLAMSIAGLERTVIFVPGGLRTNNAGGTMLSRREAWTCAPSWPAAACLRVDRRGARVSHPRRRASFDAPAPGLPGRHVPPGGVNVLHAGRRRARGLEQPT